VSCGDQGGVVMPAVPGAAFEVVQAEGVFEFAVVVLDAPADLGQSHQFGDRDVGREGVAYLLNVLRAPRN
jgi:hypothetical protein